MCRTSQNAHFDEFSCGEDEAPIQDQEQTVQFGIFITLNFNFLFRFHRIRKRQQRREMIKEVEQLLVRAPEEADEKLKELEKDRAYERTTLKHRGTNKWTKQVRKQKRMPIIN